MRLRKFFLSLALSSILFHPAAYAETGALDQGIADFKDESLEEAADSLSKARQSDPKSAQAAFYLGLTQKRLQNFREAKANLTDAISLDPNLEGAHLALAESLYHLGELDGALKELDAAEASGKDLGQVYLLRGLTQLKADKNNDAVDSFKKAKSADSALARVADYQTGIAYVKENKLSEAKEVFREIIIKDPSADLSRYAEEYARSIDKKQERERPFKLSLGLRYEYDDNVILKPADSSAANGITDEDDRREIFTLRGEYNRKFNNPWSLRAQYSLYMTNQHHLETHDIQSHTVSLIPSYNFKNSSANFNLSYNNTLVEDARYLDSVTFTPSYNFMLGPERFGVISARVQKREFQKEPFSPNEDRDSLDTGLSFSCFRFFGGDGGFFNLKYEINKEDADGVNWTYVGNKASLSLLYPYSEKLKFQAFAEASLQNYQNTHTVFGKKREDRTYTQSVLASYELYKKTDFIIQYTHVRDDSNIAIYDYDRNIISTGIEFRL